MVGCLVDEGGVNSFFAVKGQRTFGKLILADSSNKQNFRSQPGAAYRLVRSFATVVDAVAGSQHSLTRGR